MSTIYIMEAANLFCGDHDPTASKHLTLAELKLPPLQEMYQDHHAGGSRVQIEVALGIQKLEPTFKDDMGGSSANRLTNQSGGLDGDVLGATGGAETHTLTTAQLASHSHNLTYGSGSFASISPAGAGGSSASKATSSTGSNQQHNNVQPTIILNYIIKT